MFVTVKNAFGLLTLLNSHTCRIDLILVLNFKIEGVDKFIFKFLTVCDPYCFELPFVVPLLSDTSDVPDATYNNTIKATASELWNGLFAGFE